MSDIGVSRGLDDLDTGARDASATAVSELRALEREPSDPLGGLPPALRALRPIQWTKNLLVFAALIFSRNVFEPELLVRGIGAFVAFCAVSSSAYLINDLRDVEQDRLHPIKQSRPIPAGEVSVRFAVVAAILLAIFGIGLAAAVRLELAGVVVVYLVMMIGYSLGLKHLVILDVIIIALGFVLRAAGGAVAISVPISPWLYICTLLLALLVGFGKRRHELLTLQDAAAMHRQNLDSYSVAFLDQIIGVTASATIVTYSVYTFDTPALPNSKAMMLTIPFVIYAVLRYLYLLYRQHVGGSPELLLIRDRGLLLCALLWVTVSAGILYWAG